VRQETNFALLVPVKVGMARRCQTSKGVDCRVEEQGQDQGHAASSGTNPELRVMTQIHIESYDSDDVYMTFATHVFNIELMACHVRLRGRGVWVLTPRLWVFKVGGPQ
jgi:hypothetical protein